MRYYAISDPSEVKAILFFDYSKSHFSIHSSSDILQETINTIVAQKADSMLTTNDDTVIANYRNRNHPLWVDNILAILAKSQTYWKITDQGSLKINETPQSYIEENFSSF